ncbi:uncharacterized protein LOC116417609 [Nasonia vitripennis]|uniref:Uncharacterized protein n=1 Tax=Nasonia vitripennis TaxID=7425 RepID=A0A7M7QH74_NASVI|nr:uncharacterized protein LOC116417609 [Nasonia vitripennis]
MEKAFLNARCVGCNVHFDRAIYSQIKASKLVDYLKSNPEAKNFIKKFTVLAFLPAEQIREATLCNRTDKRILQNLKDFLKYVQNFWLNCVKLENFSIFVLLVRTNNAIEASHSQLRHKIGKHPQVWDFVLWKKYLMNEITAQEVLDMMASLKGHLCERIKRIKEVNVDDFHSSQMEFNALNPDFDERVLHMLTQAGALALPRDNLENPNHAVIDVLIDAPADADEEALSVRQIKQNCSLRR